MCRSRFRDFLLIRQRRKNRGVWLAARLRGIMGQEHGKQERNGIRAVLIARDFVLLILLCARFRRNTILLN